MRSIRKKIRAAKRMRKNRVSDSNFLTNSKRHITLIEVLVVIAIIAASAGLLAVKMRDFLQEQAFLDESHQLLNQLRIAQDVMQVMNADIVVKISQDENGLITSQIEPKSHPPELAKRLISTSPLKLKALGRVEFEDQFTETVLKENFDLTFMSRGFTMNHGILKLAPKGTSGQEQVIYLPGHPAPLVLQNAKNFSYPSPTEEAESIERITSATFQETINYDKNENPETPPNPA